MKIKLGELEKELNLHKDSWNKKLIRIKTVMSIVRRLSKKKQKNKDGRRKV